MQRHRDNHVVVSGRHRQLVAHVLHQRTPDRLIEAVFVTANQRGQGAGLVFGRGSVTCDSARSSVAWRVREASSASGRIVDDRLERAAANFASWIRHQLDSRDASIANASSGSGAERGAARGTSGRVEEVENLCERGHI